MSFTSTEAYNTAHGDSVSILNSTTGPPTLFLRPTFTDIQYKQMSMIKDKEYDEDDNARKLFISEALEWRAETFGCNVRSRE